MPPGQAPQSSLQLTQIQPKCPACGPIDKGKVDGVCAELACQTLKYHKKCLVVVDGTDYCSRHAKQLDNETTPKY